MGKHFGTKGTTTKKTAPKFGLNESGKKALKNADGKNKTGKGATSCPGMRQNCNTTKTGSKDY